MFVEVELADRFFIRFFYLVATNRLAKQSACLFCVRWIYTDMLVPPCDLVRFRGYEPQPPNKLTMRLDGKRRRSPECQGLIAMCLAVQHQLTSLDDLLYRTLAYLQP